MREKRRILVVDDEQDFLDSIEEILEDEYAISSTTEPLEAFQLLSETDYSLVILDEKMPNMNGLKLLQVIRGLIPNQPAIILTGYPSDDSEVVSKEMGALDYVTKGADGLPERLKAVVEANIAQIFICYAREDQQRVLTLYRQLEMQGFKPWMASEDLLPGERWKWVIMRTIRQSAFFIACITKNSEKPQSFLHAEIRLAQEIQAQMPDKDIFIIPARFEECPIPETLTELHCVDLFEEDTLSKLVEALHSRQ